MKGAAPFEKNLHGRRAVPALTRTRFIGTRFGSAPSLEAAIGIQIASDQIACSGWIVSDLL